MTPTLADLTEPIQTALERIPVQDVLERVPPEVRSHLPERLQPQEDEGRSKLWLALLVLIGVGAVIVIMRRRAAGGDELDELDLRDAPADVTFADGSSVSGVRPSV